jgi:hypothetical protein
VGHDGFDFSCGLGLTEAGIKMLEDIDLTSSELQNLGKDIKGLLLTK